MINLTSKQITAFTMIRHHLTKKSDDFLKVVRDLVGIQAQYAITPSICLWNRVDNIPSDCVEKSLVNTRNLVKTWSLRTTVHVLASADLAMIISAISRQKKTQFERFIMNKHNNTKKEIHDRDKAILHALALSNRPLRRDELQKSVLELQKMGNTLWRRRIMGLALSGDIVFAGSNLSMSDFALRRVWFSDTQWNPPHEEDACNELLQRYLSIYGPATMRDFAHWSGLNMKATRKAFRLCASELTEAKVDGQQETYYFSTQDAEHLFNLDCDKLPIICLLPKFDPLLMGYYDKSRFINDSDLVRVYRPAGHIEATILLNGRAVATWRMVRKDAKFVVYSFDGFDGFDHQEKLILQKNVERLGVFLGIKNLDLIIQK